MAAPVLVPDAHVLEVGYWSGLMSCYLASTFGVRVTGYDIDPTVAERARANAMRLDVTDRTDFRVCRPDETTSLRGTYDAVFLKSVLYHIERPEEYRAWLAWIHSILRPGGALIAIENGLGNWLTRFYRRRLSPRNYHDYCLIDRARLDDFRNQFPVVQAKHFGRYSQFFTWSATVFGLVSRLEDRLCPPTQDENFVTAIVAFKEAE